MTSVRTARLRHEDYEGGVDQLAEGLGGECVLAVVMASKKAGLTELLDRVAARFPGACVLGATTSGEFTEDGDGNETASVFVASGDFKVFAGLGSGLGASPEHAVEEALRGQPLEIAGYPHRTGIVLLDPFAGHGEEAALLLATALGDQPLVGGAAGDDLVMKSTEVGLPGRVASDALVVATLFSKRPLGIGVKHGHRSLSAESFRVTRADGSVVLEIDGRPAWDVCREVASERARSVGLDPEGKPGAFLLRFEAGLRVGGEFKVRAPLAPQPGGGILFATPMEEGTVFHIMESDGSAQIESALVAATRAREALGGTRVAGALVFDCICRKLILEDSFGGMLRQVSESLGGAPLAGFETYGEIAMNSGDMSGFHNTTCVVLAFPEDD
jgi:methyl-accepting chemotaxis protein